MLPVRTTELALCQALEVLVNRGEVVPAWQSIASVLEGDRQYTNSHPMHTQSDTCRKGEDFSWGTVVG